MNETSLMGLFILGVIFTDFFCQDILNALFSVGKGKKQVEKIKKQYSLLGRYLCKYIELPMRYNQKIAKFFLAFRKIHLGVVLIYLFLFVFFTKGKGGKWFDILMYCKLLSIDLFMVIYIVKHGRAKLFERKLQAYDFTKIIK